MVPEEGREVEVREFQHTSASLDEVLARFEVGSSSLSSDEFAPFPWASNSSFFLADIIARFFGCSSSDFKVGCRVTDDVLGRAEGSCCGEFDIDLKVFPPGGWTLLDLTSHVSELLRVDKHGEPLEQGKVEGRHTPSTSSDAHVTSAANARTFLLSTPIPRKGIISRGVQIFAEACFCPKKAREILIKSFGTPLTLAPRSFSRPSFRGSKVQAAIRRVSAPLLPTVLNRNIALWQQSHEMSTTSTSSAATAGLANKRQNLCQKCSEPLSSTSMNQGRSASAQPNSTEL